MGAPAEGAVAPSQEPTPEATPSPIQPGAKQAPEGLWTGIVNTVTGTDPVKAATAVGVGVARGAGQALGGALDAEEDLIKPLTGAVSSVMGDNPKLGDMAAHAITTLSGAPFAPYLLTQTLGHSGTFADQLSMRETLGKVGYSEVNQAVANMAAVTLGAFTGSSELLLAKSLPSIARGALSFGASEGIIGSSDPTTARFTSAIGALGVHTEFTDWLGSDDANTGRLETRFKNALDGVVSGAAFDVAFKSAKYVWSALRGLPKPTIEAAQQEALAAVHEAVPEAKSNDIVTAKVSGRASPNGEPHPDTGEPTGATGAPADANKVSFTARPAGSPPGKARVVGTMDKGDLERFYKAADYYSGHPDEIDVTEASAPDLHAGIGQIKPSLIQTPDDVAPFLRALLDDAKPIARPRSDKDLNLRVALGAAHLGLDQTTFQAFVQNFVQSMEHLDAGIGIVRAHWTSLGRAISQNFSRGTDGLTDAELKFHLDTVVSARAFGAHILDIKAGTGRAQRAWQLPSIDSDKYRKELFGTAKGMAELPGGMADNGGMPPLPRNLSELKDFYDLWGAAGTDTGAQSDLLQGNNILPTPGYYLRQSPPNAFTGSILAGKAIIKGFLMPGFVGMVQTFERTCVAGAVGMNPFIKAETRAVFRSIAANSPKAYFQTVGDMMAAVRFMAQSIRNGGRTIIGGGYSAFDANQRLGPITEAMLRAAGQPPDWRYSLGNLINVWPRAIFSLVGGHDEFTKRLSYLGEVRLDALVEGSRPFTDSVTGDIHPGLSGQALNDFAKQRLADSVDAAGQATNEGLLSKAARTSMIQQPEGPMAGVINTVNRARNVVPELRLIMPVFTVPTNELGEGIRRIPILNFAFKNSREELIGNRGRIAQAEAYGRMLTGAATLGVGFSLARNGQLTGHGPHRADDNAVWARTHQPYSLKVPGLGWVSYKDIPVLGVMLGIMGTTFDSTVYHPEDTAKSHVFAAMAGLAEFIKEKSALQGISDVLDFGGSPLADPEAQFKRLIGQISSGFVPAFIRYTRNLTDPLKRQVEGAAPGANLVEDIGHSTWSYILNSIPGASQTLDPVRNSLGEPVHVPQDTLVENILPVTIAPVSADTADDVIKELDHIYEVSGYAGGITHPSELGHGYFDPRTVTLEDGRSMYDHFIRNRMLANEDSEGLNVRDQLDQLFQSPDYKAAAYGSPDHAEDILGNESKLNMIAKVFQQANTFAKQRMAQGSPTARQLMAITDAKRASPDLLRQYDVKTLSDGPGIFKALGIDLSEYEDKVSGQ